MTYGAASGIAGTIANQVASLGVAANAATITSAFLDWSAEESGWGRDPDATDDGNWFGAGPGSWGGTANSNCPNPSFACWSVNWGDELQDILNFTPTTKKNPKHISYGGAVVRALLGRPDLGVSGIVQAIANIGFNPYPGYGARVAAVDPTVQKVVNCLKQDGRI
jgi:hypothetical protein